MKQIDFFIVIVACISAWCIAAAYRLGAQPLPAGENRYINIGLFLLPIAFVGLDYIRIRFGALMSIALATLAAVTSIVVNSSYLDYLDLTIAMTLTAPVAVAVGMFVQSRLKKYPIWQMVIITHVITNVWHSIMFHNIYHYNDNVDNYIYASISVKMFMFLLTIPLLLALLSYSFPNPNNANVNGLTDRTEILYS